jgi:riboflavin synthase
MVTSPNAWIAKSFEPMFTGLVESLAEVVQVRPEPPGSRLVVRWAGVGQPRVGESVAVNGCCLTVVEAGPDSLEFQAGPETLSRTNLGDLAAGSLVNLERALAVGDRLGGHFVTGHVDAVGTVVAREEQGEWLTMWISCPPGLSAQMASKGSVAVDGVSLTLVEVHGDRFSVALIPHTLAHTTLGRHSIGGRVNLETDLLAKYVERLRQKEEGGRRKEE